MTPRENIISLLRRNGYEYQPLDFNLCPSLEQYFKENIAGDKGGLLCTSTHMLEPEVPRVTLRHIYMPSRSLTVKNNKEMKRFLQNKTRRIGE